MSVMMFVAAVHLLVYFVGVHLLAVHLCFPLEAMKVFHGSMLIALKVELVYDQHALQSNPRRMPMSPDSLTQWLSLHRIKLTNISNQTLE